jgi:YVTN family beta-propeller protein
VIDGNNDTVKKEIPVGRHPDFILVYHTSTVNKIYVANAGSGSVSVIDGNNDTVKKEIPVGRGPDFIVEDYDYKHFTTKIYVANDDSSSVSVIDGNNDTVKKEISFPGYNSYLPMDVASNKIYVAKWGANTVSVIDGNNDTIKKEIPVGREPDSILVSDFSVSSIFKGIPLLITKVLVAGSNTVSVINPIKDTNEQNITVGYTGKLPSYGLGYPRMDSDFTSSKIYVSNSNNKTVSVIDVSGQDSIKVKKEPHDIVVGQDPGPIAINHKTRLVYVGNSAASTVSVINGFSGKVAAGVIFKVNPVDSGTIMCINQEYPTNVYIYVDNGTRCTAQGNNNFKFDRWVQKLSSNSSLPIDEPSGYLTVDRYGNFTANLKPLPPTIPQEYWTLIITLILTTVIGWSIPSIAGWYKARMQLKHLEECINQIGRLDKNAIEDKMKGYYVHGKISDE